MQIGGGAFASFLRTIKDIVSPLNNFFRKTGYKYKKYNYLGEWHSHPSFKPSPSTKDIKSMFEIVCDQSIGANFAVLLIVRLGNTEKLEATASVFLPHMNWYQGVVSMEE